MKDYSDFKRKSKNTSTKIKIENEGSKIPIAIFYGENDTIVDPTDVRNVIDLVNPVFS